MEQKPVYEFFKRIVDIVCSLMGIIGTSPLWLIGIFGILLSDPGPIFYMASRVGKDNKIFKMYKFRSMRVDKSANENGFKADTNRIFAFGEFIRRSKIDELPQLLNILFGTMTVVGPRPEDISIVENYYTDEEKKTLDVLPGLACPGSIFNYTHGDEYLKDDDTDEAYVNNFLHIKLALDIYYLDHWSLFYDAEIIVRTVIAIVMTSVLGKKLDYPREYKALYS